LLFIESGSIPEDVLGAKEIDPNKRPSLEENFPFSALNFGNFVLVLI